MYQIIDNLPIDLEFTSKTKNELELYNIWFIENKDNRILCLEELVKSKSGYENWIADFSLNSLKDLGKWLSENVEIVELSESEYKAKKAKIADWVEVPRWDLSIKTRSFLLDSGIYLGEVFIRNHSGLKWEQYFSKVKNDINHGHNCIRLRKNIFNPVWVAYILGYGLAKKNKNADSLYDLYIVWEKFI